MPLLGVLVLVIQFSFAFHVFKTGRPYWWIFIIMGFPVMGCVIYYFVEVFPGSREHRQAHRAARKLVKALQPDADLARRAEELEICGSVDNKVAMAVECTDHQMHAEAAKLYESCLQGVFANDGAILFGLAGAAVEGSAWDKAAGAIARLKADAPKQRPLEVRLLEARLLEGRGENDAALAAYRELIPQFVGLEARYRFAQMLARLGQGEAALEVFNQVLTQAKRGSGVEAEEQWAAAARRAVRGA
jgi:hypothetical protein